MPDAANAITSPATAIDPAKRTEVDRLEIKRLAQEFEALLMTQMLREMRRSMLDEDQQGGGLGAGAMTDTADVELGRSLSASGGFGLTDALLKTFERQITAIQERAGRSRLEDAESRAGAGVSPETLGGTEGPSPVSPAPSGGASIASIAPEGEKNDVAVAAGEVIGDARVSSRFGWREDPFTGAAQFHRGVDLAMAYGRDVKSAADGVVSFAGVQHGYGHTVVVDHPGGRQTRYAHLSEQLVRAGDSVAGGQILGRSGNSGRSTGPHLHFEMLVNGQPVDPSFSAE